MLNTPAPSRRKYDIIIFGATSFTGKWLVQELIKTMETTRDDGYIDNEGITKFSWAIAGRSFEKMEQVLLRVGRQTKTQLYGQIDMIEADVLRPSSIISMVQQCKLLLNCVGPYQIYGEAVVKACAKHGTHHLDLAAEPMFLGQMEQKYSEMAEKSGAFIIGGCGLSLPTDCGALYLYENFEGEVNSIEAFVELASGTSKMTTFSKGTWSSLVWSAHYLLNYLLLKGKLNGNYHPPESPHKLRLKPIQYRKEVGSWCVVSSFPDGEVMGRTQRYIVQNGQDSVKPFQTRFYVQFPKFLYMMVFLAATAFYTVIAQVKRGARILEKYPKLFTLGMASEEGPSIDNMNQSEFAITLVAKGWSMECSKDKPPNKRKVLRVQGKNPGYGASVTIFLQAALIVLSEKDKMPKRGGVYSPGIAFAKTSLISKLNQSGVSFNLEN